MGTFTQFSTPNLHSGGEKSILAVKLLQPNRLLIAFIRLSLCLNLLWCHCIQSRKPTLALVLFSVLLKTSAGCFSPKMCISLDLRGAAMCPSPLVPLVSSSSSPTLSLSSSVWAIVTAASAQLSSLLPLMASDQQGKDGAFYFLFLWKPVPNKEFLAPVLPFLALRTPQSLE